jgi:hypothetical protein
MSEPRCGNIFTKDLANSSNSKTVEIVVGVLEDAKMSAMLGEARFECLRMLHSIYSN